MATTPIIAPDGTVADVPNEHVSDLVRQGGKIGVDLLSPDGKQRATVPIDSAHDAIRKGAIYAPPMPKAPQPQPVDASLKGVVKDEAKAAVAHPGQAVVGALNEGKNLMESVLPAAEQLPPVSDAELQKLGMPKPAAPNPNSPIAKGFNAVSNVVGKVFHPPQTEAEQAGAHATDVTAAVANAPAAVKTVANIARGAKNAVSGAIDAFRMPAAAPDVKTVQPALQNGVKKVLSDVAAENGVPAPKAQGIRDAAKEVGDAIMAKSKDLYSKIDAATEGEFTNINRALENLNQEMRLKLGVNKDADAALKLRKIELEMSMTNAMETAAKNGVDPEVAKQAAANFKKAQALYDMDAQIKKAVPYTQLPTNQTANVKGLYRGMNGMFDEGRLAEAVGADRAKQVMAHAENASDALDTIKEQQKAVSKRTAEVKSNRKQAITVGAAAAGGGLAIDAGRRVFSGLSGR